MLIDKVSLDDEEGRVRALERYRIVDTEEEGAFETIVTLVEQTLGASMCGISLIDRRRHWFKAKRGIGQQVFERRLSFCNRTIERIDPLVLSDTLKDPNFADHPLVTGEPYIRSYIGAPLTTPDGYNIGSLCVLGQSPRSFSEHEVSILENFAKVIMNDLELRQMASTDVLTGSLSRRACIENARRDLGEALRGGRPFSLAIFDIDRFKLVNDAYGHAAGDTVIRALAEHVEQSCRETDTFGRLGGEEFILVLPELDARAARVFCNRLREDFAALSIPIKEGKTVQCTTSIGIATRLGETDVSDTATIEALLESADKALYQAKQSGRNRVMSVSELVNEAPEIGGS